MPITVTSASLKRHQADPKKVQATVDLGTPTPQGGFAPHVVAAPMVVWYELSGGVTHQGEMKATAKAGRYRHNHVSLAGDHLRLVIKLVTDTKNVEPIFDQSLPVT